MRAIAVVDSDFTWINRDAENLTSKEHGHDVRIHVQKQRRSRLSRLKASSVKAPKTQFPWSQSESVHRKGEAHQTTEGLSPPSKQQKSYITTRATPFSHPSASAPLNRRALPNQTTATFVNTSKTIVRRCHKSPDFLLPTFSSSPLSSPLTSQLDPFFSLPCHVTERDKSLLHLYFTMTPKTVYGTHNNASICPIRDVTAIGVREDPVFLQWIVLGAELYLLQGKSSAANQPHILSRKAYIYRLMNKIISDPNLCYADTTFATMGAAAIAAGRFESPAQGRRHLVALRKLIEARGGSKVLENMLLAYSISITNCFINIGTEHATFTDKSGLNIASHDFISGFQAMQAWNQRLRVEFEASATADDVGKEDYTSGKLPSVSAMLDAARLRNLEKYRVRRARIFGATSLLGRYIPPIYPLPSVSERRCHFVALWMINKILYDLRHDHRESMSFIERLSSEVKACEIPTTEGDLDSKFIPLKPLAIIYILETIAVKHSPKTASIGGILLAWHSINPLELIELATKDSHVEMTVLLSSWLTNDGLDIFYMTENRLEEISEEISAEWLRRRSSKMTSHQ